MLAMVRADMFEQLRVFNGLAGSGPEAEKKFTIEIKLAIELLKVCASIYANRI